MGLSVINSEAWFSLVTGFALGELFQSDVYCRKNNNNNNNNKKKTKKKKKKKNPRVQLYFK